MSRQTLLVLAIAATLSACATTPAPLQGEYSAVQPDQAVAQQRPGDPVRWGGRIVDVHTEKLYTCFEIVSAPLDSSSRPRRVDSSGGRFLACRSGFYEPEVFAPGRELTVSGHIDGYETRKVGDYDYRYPRVAADVVYLWPEYRERRYPYYDPFYGPYSGPLWPPGWGGPGRGYFGRWW